MGRQGAQSHNSCFRISLVFYPVLAGPVNDPSNLKSSTVPVTQPRDTISRRLGRNRATVERYFQPYAVVGNELKESNNSLGLDRADSRKALGGRIGSIVDVSCETICSISRYCGSRCTLPLASFRGVQRLGFQPWQRPAHVRLNLLRVEDGNALATTTHFSFCSQP